MSSTTIVEQRAQAIANSQDPSAVGFIPPVEAWQLLVMFAKLITMIDGACEATKAKQVLQASAVNGQVGEEAVAEHCHLMVRAHKRAARKARRHDAEPLPLTYLPSQYMYLTRRALQDTLDQPIETVSACFASAAGVEDGE